MTYRARIQEVLAEAFIGKRLKMYIIRNEEDIFDCSYIVNEVMLADYDWVTLFGNKPERNGGLRIDQAIFLADTGFLAFPGENGFSFEYILEEGGEE